MFLKEKRMNVAVCLLVKILHISFWNAEGLFVSLPSYVTAFGKFF